jgi:hypothetical protein
VLAARVGERAAPDPTREADHMPLVTTPDGTENFYKDWGGGQPIMFHHGWPLSFDDWDAQMMFSHLCC